MAAYNCWQNDGLRKIVTGMNPDVLTRNQGAFFGSIMGTLNHLLWGDTLWISRFDCGPTTDLTIPDSPQFTPDVAAWDGARAQMDARIARWADVLQPADLKGELQWYSGSMQRDFAMPKAICVMQLFNHQTHHRGQVHAMLTAVGEKTGDTDLPFMP